MFNKDSDTLNITIELLGLSNVKVGGVRPNLSSNEIVITAKSIHEFVSCQICKKPTKRQGCDRTFHLPILGQDTLIEITPRRGICSNCDNNPTTTERMDWYNINSKYTELFESTVCFLH